MTEHQSPPPPPNVPPSEERPAETRPTPPDPAVELPSCLGEPVLAAPSERAPTPIPAPPPPPAFTQAPPPVPAASVAAALGLGEAPKPPREPQPSAPSAPMPPLYTPPPPEPVKVPGEPEPPNAPPPQGPPPDAWAPAADEPRRPSHEGWALAMHLSAVITLGFAWLLLGFVGPLILWIAKKDDDPELDWHGREALNFQLNLLLFWIAGLPLLLVCCLGLVVWAVLPFYGIVLGLIASLKAADGKRWKYPLTLRLLND